MRIDAQLITALNWLDFCDGSRMTYDEIYINIGCYIETGFIEVRIHIPTEYKEMCHRIYLYDPVVLCRRIQWWFNRYGETYIQQMSYAELTDPIDCEIVTIPSLPYDYMDRNFCGGAIACRFD